MGDGTGFSAGKIREFGTQSGTLLIPIERGARRIFPAEETERHCPTFAVSAHLTCPPFSLNLTEPWPSVATRSRKDRPVIRLAIAACDLMPARFQDAVKIDFRKT
jgi:hypothetical protein